jgi:hypothetical protein
MAVGRELLLLILSAAALAGLASAAGPFLSGACLPFASSCSCVSARFSFSYFPFCGCRFLMGMGCFRFSWLCADTVFQGSSGSVGRSLLQAKQSEFPSLSCPCTPAAVDWRQVKGFDLKIRVEIVERWLGVVLLVT